MVEPQAPPAAAAAASTNDQLAKLRALTDPNLDEEIGTVLLLMSDGNAQAAAAHYREQFEYGKPSPSPAPAPAPPTATSPKSIAASSNITGSITGGSGTSAVGGRRRAKATGISSVLLDSGIIKEPVMDLGPTGGLVVGRDRGFAKNRQYLDDTAFHEPRLFTDPQMTASLSASLNALTGYNSLDNAYGFATPGAYNEIAEGDGFVSRERRDTALYSAPVRGQHVRRTSDQLAASEPMAQTSPRRCATNENQRRTQPQQLYHSREPHQAQLKQENSWTGRSIAAMPASHRMSAVSMQSDLTGNDSSQGGVDLPDLFHPDDAKRRSSERSSAEPGFVSQRSREERPFGSTPTNLRLSNTSTVSHLDSSRSLLCGLQEESEQPQRQSSAGSIPSESLKEPPMLDVGSASYSSKPDPPGETIDTPWLHSPRQSPVPPGAVDVREPSLSPTPPTFTLGAEHKPRARRTEAGRPGSTTEEQLHDSLSSSMSAQPKSGKERGRAPATQPGVVRVAADEELANSVSKSMSLNEPNAKARRTPASVPGAVQMSNSVSKKPAVCKSKPPSLQTSNPEPDAKIRRAPATQPGVVNVSDFLDEAADALRTSGENFAGASSRTGDSTVDKDLKNRSRRTAPATKPGAVSVGAKVEVCEPLRDSISSLGTDENLAKVRRTPAIGPGAVSVRPEEPHGDSATSLDAGHITHEPHVGNVVVPTGKVRHRKPASQPGAVNVTGPEEENTAASRDQKDKEKTGHGLKHRKAPGVVHVMGTTNEDQTAEQSKASKFSLGPKPEVVVQPNKATSSAGDKSKDSKIGKGSNLNAVKPGAVSVQSSDGSMKSDDDAGKLSGLRRKATKPADEGVDPNNSTMTNDASNDPSLDGPDYEQEDGDSLDRGASLPSNAHHHLLAPQNTNARDGTAASPTNRLQIPLPVPVGSLGAGEHRSSSPFRCVSDPLEGLDKVRVPVNHRSSDSKVKRSKGIFGGLFKKKGKRHSETESTKEEMQEIQDELSRIGSSRPMGRPLPGRGHP